MNDLIERETVRAMQASKTRTEQAIAETARRQPADYRLAVLSLIAFMVVMVAMMMPASAATLSPGTSGNREQQEATNAIPFAQLTPEAHAKISSVVTRSSLYRRLPVEQFDCDPDMFVYLIRYPEIIANMWEVMGVSKLAIKRTDAFRFHAADGAGTVSNVELIYGTANTHVFYAEGSYTGPVLSRTVNASCVALMRSNYARGTDGRTYVTGYLDVFIKLDGAGADLMARTIFPLVSKTADGNFTETSKFMASVSRSAESNPHGLQRNSAKLTRVDPTVLLQFNQVAAAVNQKAVAQAQAQYRATQQSNTTAKPVAAFPSSGPAAPSAPIQAGYPQGTIPAVAPAASTPSYYAP